MLEKIYHKLMEQFIATKSSSVNIEHDVQNSPPQIGNYSISSSSLWEPDVFSACSSSNKQLSPKDLTVSYDDVLSDVDNTDFTGYNIYEPVEDINQGATTPVVDSLFAKHLYSEDELSLSGCCDSSENGFNSLYKSITENWLLKPPPFILKHLVNSSRVPINLEKYRIKTNEVEPLRKSKTQATEVTTKPKTSRPLHVRSYSDGTKYTKHLYAPQMVKNPPYSSDLPFRLKNNLRFMEDGGHSIEAGAYGFFPRPRPGQHLFDFLSDCYSATTNAQLDRENAHFSIAEAVIGAIEQMNYEAQLNGMVVKPMETWYASENDKLPAIRTNWRRQKMKIRKKLETNVSTSDEGINPENSVCTSDEPVSSDPSHSSSSETTEISVCEFASTGEIANSVEVLGNSNDAGITDHSASSAENLAISLLINYNSNLLPKAIDLKWRFSEEEELNKKPDVASGSTTPEESFEVIGNTSIRGTADWAPPRPQLVLTIHKKPNRLSCIVSQNLRCAGCGLKVCNKMSRYFRVCTYLGKYFCTSCHTNKKSIIPAYVIFNWDFSSYPVSNFSSELLSRMQSDPLFNITCLNVSLYKQCQNLNQCHVYRLQLFHARKYVITCRNAKKENEMLNAVPIHWSTEPHVYSIDDLYAIKYNSLLANITNLTTVLIKHISSCQVCLGQGFVCEMCKNGAPIFPFQLDAVTQCSKCKACYHIQCFLPDTVCGRCLRRDEKQKRNFKEFADLPIS